jgi:hypothetical protein
MGEKDTGASPEMLTPEEMGKWLKQEIADSTKACELRIREASDLVASYTRGGISPAEALKRMVTYDERWGEALFGVSAGGNITDDAIISAIDKARSESRKRASLSHRARAPRDGGTAEHSI